MLFDTVRITILSQIIDILHASVKRYFCCYLGKIPLRRLVYRVLPLPPSMNQYIYDFGAISGETEDKYISRIVSNHVS